MLFAFLVVTTLSFIATIVHGDTFQLGERQDCGSSYSKCSPSGAAATSIPDVGSALSSIYLDLLDSISGVKITKRMAQQTADILGARSPSANVCCKLSFMVAF